MPYSLTDIHNALLTVPEVERHNGIMAFSLRGGGCSPLPRNSLNFSYENGDSRSNVQQNLDILARHLHIEASRILTCTQIHGDSVAIVEKIPEQPVRADALIATVPGLFPGIRTADCLPILMLDPVTKISAAVHAGWRGTVLRITRKVLHILTDRFSVDPKDLIAAMGPAIGPCCYEVDDAVLKPLMQALPTAERFVRTVPARHEQNHGPGQSRSRRLDLQAANLSELISHGVLMKNIVSADLCTACNPDLFFSHRRDGNPSGRHLSVVGFREE